MSLVIRKECRVYTRKIIQRSALQPSLPDLPSVIPTLILRINTSHIIYFRNSNNHARPGSVHAGGKASVHPAAFLQCADVLLSRLICALRSLVGVVSGIAIRRIVDGFGGARELARLARSVDVGEPKLRGSSRSRAVDVNSCSFDSYGFHISLFSPVHEWSSGLQ